MEQAKWDALSDTEKDRAVMEALVMLPAHETALWMQTAHTAIVAKLESRS